jgi:hypothetical protein
MDDIDFGFFNLAADKRGLAYEKFFLDRLAPFLFVPRLHSLIELPGLKAKGSNIKLPLGPQNIKTLDNNKRELLFQKTINLADRYHLQYLAVDRRLKKYFMDGKYAYPYVFGDKFIKALASALIKHWLGTRGADKIIITGNIRDLTDFIEDTASYGVPVSLQGFHPSRYEVLAHRLLYEKGLAVSTSMINPYQWGKGDLVVVFDEYYQRFSLVAPDAWFLSLYDNSRNLAPELENRFLRNGLDASIYTLAPVLESCILSKGGLIKRNAELEMDNYSFLYLRELGEQLGLWEQFLDKGI